MTVASYAVGIDPGARSGALVLLRVTAAGALAARWRASWLRLERKDGAVWRLTCQLWDGALEIEETSRSPALFADLAARLAQAAGGLSGVDAPVESVAVEGLFFDVRSANGARELHLRTGDLMGCLSRAGYAPDLQPPAAAWRPAILGISPSTEAAAAEAAAVRWATAHVWPAGLTGRTAVEVGALSEAAAIALHGLRETRRRAAAA